MDISKKYGGIDIFKFLFAICVIAIHTHPLNACNLQPINTFFDIVFSIAVPFFFLALGFFVFPKNTQFTKETLLVRIKSIIKLYITWTIIYLPISIAGYFFAKRDILTSFLLFGRGVLFVGENQNSWPLWYLLSTIYSLVVIYILLFKMKKGLKTTFIVSIIFLILSNVVTMILQIEAQGIIKYFVFAVKAVIPSGRILTGLFYITLGIIISKYEKHFTNNKFYYSIVVFLAFVTTILLKSIFPAVASNFFTPLCSVLIFLFAINLPIKVNNFTIALRKSSAVMYFVHMIIFTIYSLSISNTFQLYGLEAFLVVLLISMVTSAFVLSFRQKIKFLNTIF